VPSGDDAAQLLRFHAFLLHRSRVERYRVALAAAVRPGDVVLDLGAGAGILSLLACEAGAARVYAVEASPALELARELFAANGVAERVVAIAGRSTEIDLPERADVLVSDLFETLGVNDGIVASTIDARERLLKPGAAMLPRSIETLLTPVHLPRRHHDVVGVWRDGSHGFDLSALRSQAAALIHPVVIEPSDLLARPVSLGRVDLATTDSPGVSATIELTALRAAPCHGLGGWFAAELTDELVLSSDPRDATLAYSQAFMPLVEPLELAVADQLTVDVASDDGRAWSWHVEQRRGDRVIGVR